MQLCDCPDCSGVETESNRLEPCINGAANAEIEYMKSKNNSQSAKSFMIMFAVLTVLLAIATAFT